MYNSLTIVLPSIAAATPDSFFARASASSAEILASM